MTLLGRATLDISVKDLNAWYDAIQVLFNVSIDFRKQHITALVGPSGGGKSTFIRTLNRMHELLPKAKISGQIFFGGQDIYCPTVDPVRVRRQIGMVFDKPHLFPLLSIRQNVLAGCQLQGICGENMDDILQKSLQQTELWEELKDSLDSSIAGLSLGQQQRLCIARALAVSPTILLLDSPCSILDPIATAQVESLFHTLKNDYTLIVATHSVQQASRISDYTAFFHKGSLIEESKTSTFFTRPKKVETERYLTGIYG